VFYIQQNTCFRKVRVLFSIVFFIAFMILAIATICDFRSREIPDSLSVGIAVLALASCLMGWLGINLWLVLAGGAVGLAIGFALFHFANLGGGDAKLIAAMGLLLGPAGIFILLFWTAVSGGVLSLVAMLRGQRDYACVPAITAGFVGYWVMVSFR